jgi:hypothetical protein
MHRQITGAPNGLEVDHRNRIRTDNRRANLLVVPHDRNAQNLGKNKTYYGRPTTSSHRGVFWNKRRKRWMATVTVDGVKVLNGFFIEEHEAAVAAAEARAKWMTHSVESQAEVA